MLGEDLENVAVAEPCHEVLIVYEKMWCYQFATAKQRALFHSNHKEHNIAT
jgi:hypothetical protein